jgi:hypothetical protein
VGTLTGIPTRQCFGPASGGWRISLDWQCPDAQIAVSAWKAEIKIKQEFQLLQADYLRKLFYSDKRKGSSSEIRL